MNVGLTNSNYMCAFLSAPSLSFTLSVKIQSLMFFFPLPTAWTLSIGNRVNFYVLHQISPHIWVLVIQCLKKWHSHHHDSSRSQSNTERVSQQRLPPLHPTHVPIFFLLPVLHHSLPAVTNVYRFILYKWTYSSILQYYVVVSCNNRNKSTCLRNSVWLTLSVSQKECLCLSTHLLVRSQVSIENWIKYGTAGRPDT